MTEASVEEIWYSKSEEGRTRILMKVIKGRRGDIPSRLSDLQFALVWKNGPLVKLEGEKYTMKRHLEIELPEGMTYLPGSHLQVASFISVWMKTATHCIKKVSGHVRAQFPTTCQSVPSKSFNTMLNLTYQHQIKLSRPPYYR